MIQIHPNKVATRELHQYLLSIVGPRPIALASTIDSNEIKNVSPFSFFNLFSANPPIAIFSPARRVKNNTEKDTLKNIQEIKEVVINIVNYNLVEKASLSSTEYPKEVDEFIKAGLTPIKSKILEANSRIVAITILFLLLALRVFQILKYFEFRTNTLLKLKKIND